MSSQGKLSPKLKHPPLQYHTITPFKISKTKTETLALNSPLKNENETEQQLLNEIEKAKEVIQSYSGEIMMFGDEKNWLELLWEMERSIQERNSEINKVNREIKELRMNPEQVDKETLKKFKSFKSIQISKLADEVSELSKDFACLQNVHQKKRGEYEKSKKMLVEIEETYCSPNELGGSIAMTYQEFIKAKKLREKEREKEKEHSNSKSKKLLKRNMISIREFPYLNEENKKNTLISTNLKEVEAKRDIAESALKTLRRKHQNELNELHCKLDFLNDENEELDIKMKQKVKELQSVELRFSETKKSLSNKRHKISRYSETSL